MFLARAVAAASRPALRRPCLLLRPAAAPLSRWPTAPALCSAAPQRSFSTELEPVGKKPTIEDIEHSPREYYEMPPDVILALCATGDEDAREERLRREIMVQDRVSWDDAELKLNEIKDANDSIQSLNTTISKTGFKTMAFVRPLPRPRSGERAKRDWV